LAARSTLSVPSTAGNTSSFCDQETRQTPPERVRSPRARTYAAMRSRPGDRGLARRCRGTRGGTRRSIPARRRVEWSRRGGRTGRSGCGPRRRHRRRARGGGPSRPCHLRHANEIDGE
jgi:hypothetical protein